MTTQVTIKSSRPNHLAVKVEATNPDGTPNGYGTHVLGDGGKVTLYVHSGSVLRVSEVSRDEIPCTNGPAELTFGEKAAGCGFNPVGSADVANCKEEFAAIIDRMHALRNNSTDPEVKRMASIAITEAQTAQMWAVKAITWRG